MKKKDLKNEVKDKSKKEKKKSNTKKVKVEKKDKFTTGLKAEIKKVVWPSKKEVLKYTVATLVFCIILMVFFQLLDLGLSVIKGAIN